MKTPVFSTCAVLAGAAFNGVSAIDLDVNSRDSIKSVSSEIAAGLISYYDPDVPNLLPEPCAWWHAGAMFSTLVDYWALTGDASYLSTTQNALISQVGPNKNYMPDSQMGSLANNEQGIWALAAMAAAEHGFPFPQHGDAQDDGGWATYAKNVFDDFVARWDTQTCDGGLRWQISPSNKGYDYKDVESNGAFFQLAARLAVYHSDGDGPYADWARKVLDWFYDVEFISIDGSVKDGGYIPDCGEGQGAAFTYEFSGIHSALLIEGAVNMFNVTKEYRQWGSDFTNLVTRATEYFFYKDTNIMWEFRCENSQTCGVDPRMYKRFLARALSKTTIFAPYTKETLMPLLTASAEGAAKQCSSGGGTNKTTKCELEWTGLEQYAGETGLGAQMSALQVIQALLVEDVERPTPTFFPPAPTGSPTGSPTGTAATESASSTPTDEPNAAAALTAGGILGHHLVAFLAVLLV